MLIGNKDDLAVLTASRAPETVETAVTRGALPTRFYESLEFGKSLRPRSMTSSAQGSMRQNEQDERGGVLGRGSGQTCVRHRQLPPLLETYLAVEDFAGCDESNFRTGFSFIFLCRSVR